MIDFASSSLLAASFHVKLKGLNDGFLNPVGFAGGQTGTEAYKSAVVAPFILATKSMQNLRGQTTGSHYITFLGDPKC